LALDTHTYRFYIVDPCTKHRSVIMRVEFQKWGNSLALRVPSAFAKEIGAVEGKKGDMTVENGALVIKVLTKRKRKHTLEELLKTQGPEEELYWGPQVGNEIW
jgi:antitoxin MazE